ncbi:hypothetical protein [Desulfobacula phenolica]|uniref:Uncharacterized protein n=1 Tax=Desulfobacula phenolica TaxID=90732 RepID=A0A1H2H5V0_9BACT|nr:hypothetical protein [Desulfobacula phenolica]SDU27182.1 hypothetical protein SAMN04487931_10660 [Desulfobacula phenolica]
MLNLRLSWHFINNWRDRVGNEPTVGAVKAIIRESIIIQKGRQIKEDYRSLTRYCHFGLNLIISIDHISGTAVSVLSDVNMPGGYQKKTNEKQRVRHPGYIAMTMHR